MKLRTKIFLIAILPVVLVSVIALSISTSKIKDAIMDQAYDGMEATSVSIRNIFQFGADGEYRLDENDQMWKGNTLNISESTDIVDGVKSQTGFDVTIFYGDTRYLTTVTDDNGTRQIGTKAAANVVDTVIKSGQTLGSDNVDVMGTRYLCYYVPIFQEDTNTPVGMVFIGKPYSIVSEAISSSIGTIGIPIIFVLLISVVCGGFIGDRIIKSINQGIGYLGSLEDGKIGFKIDKDLLSRKDIVGEMCRSIESLNVKLASVIKQIQNQCNILDENSRVCNSTADELNDSISQISAVVQEVAATTTSQAQDAEAANDTISAIYLMRIQGFVIVLQMNLMTRSVKSVP